MRDLSQTLAHLLALIPPDEAHGLRFRLTRLRDSIIFTAPEAIGWRWRDGGLILAAELGHLAQLTGWRKAVVDAWMDRSSPAAALPPEGDSPVPVRPAEMGGGR